MSNQIILRSRENFDHLIFVRTKTTLEDGTVVRTNVIRKEYDILGRWHGNKNITLIDQEDWEEIKDYPQIKSGLERRIMEILDSIPNNYWDAQEQASRQRQALSEKEDQVRMKDIVISDKDREIEELKRKLEDNGIR